MAEPIRKVEPTEKGKTKSVRKPSALRQAWERVEREAARWFQTNDGPDPEMKHVVTSCGRVGQLTHLQYDAASLHYVIEVKRRETAPSWLTDAWDQIVQKAKSRIARHPVLVIHIPGWVVIDGKKYHRQEMHCLTPERHAELLEYERLVTNGS